MLIFYPLYSKIYDLLANFNEKSIIILIAVKIVDFSNSPT